jgi:nicotinamidase-related amidase
LILVDLQKGFDEPYWGERNNARLEDNVAALLAAWRKQGRPVIHVKHMSQNPRSPLRPGQGGNDFKEVAAPLPGEAVLEKRVNSCFIGTPLEALLRERGHDTVVLAGIATNHCVSTTARMAGNLGFRTFVLEDCTAAFDRVGPDGTAYPADLVHAMSLSDLHGEFATVVSSAALWKELGG